MRQNGGGGICRFAARRWGQNTEWCPALDGEGAAGKIFRPTRMRAGRFFAPKCPPYTAFCLGNEDDPTAVMPIGPGWLGKRAGFGAFVQLRQRKGEEKGRVDSILSIENILALRRKNNKKFGGSPMVFV